MKLQDYLVDLAHHTTTLKHLLAPELLLLPLSFDGHAITLLKTPEYLIRCDRGAFGKTQGSIIYYHIQHPEHFTPQLIRELLYQRQNAALLNNKLVTELGLIPQQTLDLPLQKTGNCSWANVEAAIPALLFWLLRQEDSHSSLSCEQEALQLHQYWLEWDKNRSLEFCLQGMNTKNQARRASKAALLAALLYQGCDYTNPTDRVRATKILKILGQPEYRVVLQCYNKIFSQHTTSPLWHNFKNYLDEFGIDLATLG